MARGTFYITEKIGPKQSLTPEGFLLCEEVPLARTGMMIYGPDETPIEAGPDGIVKIFREDDDVFNSRTIASAQGKPVTNDHPDDDVTPESWKDLAHGIMLNVRRGDSAMDDLLIGDLLITTPEGIEAVQGGKREVSLGYEADYEPLNVVGTGRQSNIIINHIALVEQGRCGPRCAIGDKKPILSEGKSMAKKSKILDALMRAFKAKDAEEVEQLAKEVADEGEPKLGDNGETHIHIHSGQGTSGGEVIGDDEPEDLSNVPSTDDALQEHIAQNAAEHQEMMARIEALEQALAGKTGDEEDPELVEEMKDEFPEELQEEATKAKDSAYFADSFQDTVALAEILVPGIRIPTYDRALKPSQTFKKICGFRKQAIDLAYGQPATRGILDDLLDGKPLATSKMTCDAARTLFRSAAAMKRAMNNSSGRTDDTIATGNVKKAGPKSLAELNKINAERWATK